jgi:putative nucleotidyltransferase with HDIG domain
MPQQPSEVTVRMERIISDVRRLRPMPTVVHQILRAVEDPRTTANSICELIRMDQALTAQVLQMANSALLGYGPTCSSISDAVMRIGFNRLRTLMIGVTTSGPLTRRLSGYNLQEGDLYRHSLAAAMAAQRIARFLQYPDPEEAYVAGLLHDMGKMVLDQYMQLDYQEVTKYIQEKQVELIQVEEQLFGIDHAGVGGLMATRWNFPALLSDAIRFHHTPSLARTKQELASIVNIANAITPEDAISQTGMSGRYSHPEAARLLRLNPDHIEKIRLDMEESLKMGPRT